MTRRGFAAGLALILIAGTTTAQDDRPKPTKPPTGPDATRWKASGTQGAVVAGGAEAVEAGIAILRDGGNAADAAVATILALSVTDANPFCFGGEVPILVYDAKRKVVEVLAGQGAAPRLATREHFTRPGGIPARGIESAAVPAALDACLTALDRYGTRTFAEVAAPRLCASSTAASTPGTPTWPGRSAASSRPSRLGRPPPRPPPGRRLLLPRPDRPRDRRLVAGQRRPDPRRRPGHARHPHRGAGRDRVPRPHRLQVRPLDAGPLPARSLAAPRGLRPGKAMGHNRPDADPPDRRGDEAGPRRSRRLLRRPALRATCRCRSSSPAYAALRRGLIDPSHASLVQRPGDPLGGKPLLDRSRAPATGSEGPPNDTTTCLVADGLGNVVAATPSGWSGVVAGETGVWLGTRLQSFNTWDGHPNCIEPGKRPRITLTPTLVLKDGKPVLAVSVAGGDNQDQVTLQLLLNLIDFGLDPPRAVTAPRFSTDHLPRLVPPGAAEARQPRSSTPRWATTTIEVLSGAGA